MDEAPGIYRASYTLPSGQHLVKYQVAHSASDAARRASEFDDLCWRVADFRFLEPCVVSSSDYHSNHTIVALKV